MQPAVLLCLGHFAPPTVAHLRAFERARDFAHLALGVRVVEGLLAPLAGECHGLSVKHRMRMVEAAIRRSSWLRLGAWQCSQTSSNPRPITVIFHYATESRKKYGDDTKLFLLCGDKLLLEMGEGLKGSWTQPELDSLLVHHGLFVIKRGSSPLGDLIYRHDIFRRHQNDIHIIEDETFPNYLSSERVRYILCELETTERLRTALHRGESVRYCVDDDVLEYIQDLHLFDSSHDPHGGPPPTPPSPPRMAPNLSSWRTPPPSETSTQGESGDGQLPDVSGMSTLAPSAQPFDENGPPSSMDSSLLLPPGESVVQLEQFMEKEPGTGHCSAIITLSPARSKRKKEEKPKKSKPPPLGSIQPAPLSPTYDNVTLEDLLEASTSWAEFMGRQRDDVYEPTRPSKPPPKKVVPPPIPPRAKAPEEKTEKRSGWFCNRKQQEDLVGICAADRRKLGQLSPDIFKKWTKFEEESQPSRAKKTSSARFIDHDRSYSPPAPMSQSLHEGQGVTLTFRRYHLPPSAPETTV